MLLGWKLILWPSCLKSFSVFTFCLSNVAFQVCPILSQNIQPYLNIKLLPHTQSLTLPEFWIQVKWPWPFWWRGLLGSRVGLKAEVAPKVDLAPAQYLHVQPLTSPKGEITADRNVIILLDTILIKAFFFFSSNKHIKVKHNSVVIVKILGCLIRLKVKTVGLVSNWDEELAIIVKIEARSELYVLVLMFSSNY